MYILVSSRTMDVYTVEVCVGRDVSLSINFVVLIL